MCLNDLLTMMAYVNNAAKEQMLVTLPVNAAPYGCHEKMSGKTCLFQCVLCHLIIKTGVLSVEILLHIV
jgi:hypothetical protein